MDRGAWWATVHGTTEQLSSILGKRLEENNGPAKIYDREKKFK